MLISTNSDDDLKLNIGLDKLFIHCSIFFINPSDNVVMTVPLGINLLINLLLFSLLPLSHDLYG